MKRGAIVAINTAILLLAVTPFSHAADKTPAKIIDRYRKASGRGIKNIRSTLMSGTIVSPGSAPGTFSLQSENSDRLRIDIAYGELRISECHNGKSSWRLEKNQLKTLLGDEARRIRLDALLVAGRLSELGRSRIVPTYSGAANVGVQPCDIVEFARDGVRERIFFDAASHLIARKDRETSAGVEQMIFTDYRAVDGILEPFSIRISRPGLELDVRIDRLVHNAGIEAAAFRYPELPGARPLPALEPILKSLTQNQDKIEELREHYTCRLTETTRKLDGDGRIKESETRVYEVTPVAGSLVERLMQVNGIDLSPGEREKEDRRVQREVEELLKRQEKENRKKEAARQRGKEEEKDDEIRLSDFLRICDITSIRRETFRGEEVIAFDFEPKKGFKPRNRGESLVNKLAGTIWVDEEACQIARLEAHLTDSFKFAGGMLASIGSSTAFVFEQEKVGGEVWLPSYGEANISARVLLVAKFNRNMIRQYSDYKKYQIGSDYKLEKPK